MEFPGIRDSRVELRKINATILKAKPILYSKDELSDECQKIDNSPPGIKLGFKQRNENKDSCTFHVSCEINASDDLELEMIAEIVGIIYFNSSYNISKKENPEVPSIMGNIIVPRVFEEINTILSPIYSAMGISYEDLEPPEHED
ncbi:hypothetical protein [Methanohalophilus euhalobius]|jgi:hypothetical protein|uniref:Preprotein translocase subunit SecB n=1 Tax=Methanohalophilus euhalobius TaxID=51203 RepID=A0A314ZMN7_9EURY|nr:hypothetical protein [Methanohalophilus euhalobius]PQV42349.1 hypothetical protein B0H22_107127 [Methanohalophilus euhalobius]RNI07776.1 hypothetical protein EDD83_07490 [Methanohalophilus euhalobius]RSD33700.1 MAG: hypothetical protein CI953_1388 [Methanohalophilus sp.]